MKIDILTLFPEMFKGVFDQSMIRLAQEKGLAEIKVHNIRKWTFDKHQTADDKPYGGGPGMVLKIEPIDLGIKELKSGSAAGAGTRSVLLTPQGRKFDQSIAREYSSLGHVIIVCGHYEGVDERIRHLVDDELSVGDYILTCGEVPAMVVSDAVIRLLPGVLGDEQCLEEESFENGLLEYPQYTRPYEYNKMTVPDVLLCGDPKKIDKWRKEEALKRTRERRPDLLG